MRFVSCGLNYNVWVRFMVWLRILARYWYWISGNRVLILELLTMCFTADCEGEVYGLYTREMIR